MARRRRTGVVSRVCPRLLAQWAPGPEEQPRHTTAADAHIRANGHSGCRSATPLRLWDFVRLFRSRSNVIPDWDRLQKSVAPLMASSLSHFILASHGAGREVSGGSARRSEGGKSGVTDIQREGSERGSAVTGATWQTKQSIARSRSQASADRSDAGTDMGSERGRSSQHSGTVKSKQKSESGGGRVTRFKRQHGFLASIETRNALDTPLLFPLAMMQDELLVTGHN